MIQMADHMSRLGTESAFEVLARAAKLQAGGMDVINLGIGQPDFKTPDHIVDAAVKAMRDGHHGYTPANGIVELREAVAADFEKRNGVVIDPDNVVVVPGGKVTMFFAIMMFGAPGVEILYPDPGFPIYRSVIDFSGATAVPIRLREENEFSLNAQEVLDLITPATRLLILNSPANPTGGVLRKEDLDQLVEGLQAHPQVVVLSDEIYSQMLYDGHEHVSLMQYESIRDRVILLDGWSKTYAMTGWRLGYAIWPKELAEPATRLAINCHSCVNAPTQFAGLAALTGPQHAVHEMTRAFDKRRKIIVPELNDIPGFSCVNPGGAFYAFPNISGTGLTARQFQDGLLEEVGVATVAGTSFGEYGEGFIRFSYANSIENIQAALQRIRVWLQAR